LRAQLGNDIPIKAYREGKLPFPDGSIIVALHWKRVPSDEDNQVFGRVQAFRGGVTRDHPGYGQGLKTARWGFGDFRDGKASDQAPARKNASPATCQSKIPTMCSPITHHETPMGRREAHVACEGRDTQGCAAVGEGIEQSTGSVFGVSD